MDHDLIVIGGGAAGLAAIRTALWAGADVALITDSPPGGDCTFTGCVPSKTLLSGLREGLDFEAANERVRATVAHIAASESAEVLRKSGTTVIEGRARLITHDTVAVGERRISAPRIVIATGSRPSSPEIPGLMQAQPLSSENIFDITQAPATLGVIGAGATGCEMAYAFALAGTKVTLFESQSRLLPDTDPEASAVIGAVLERLGVTVQTDAEINSITTTSVPGQSITIQAASKHQAALDKTAAVQPITCEKLLIATGRTPCSSDLGLEDLRIKLDDQGYVITDNQMMTSLRGVYAAGDVTGRALLSHAADEMGRIAAGNALGKAMRGRFDERMIPRVVFTTPEVASVGVNQSRAPAGSRVAYLPLAEVDRALIENQTDGFISIVAGPRRWLGDTGGGQILGATIVAPRAGEMISEVVLAMRTGAFTGRLAQASHAYPSWSNGVQKTVAQFFGEIEGRRASVIGD